MLPHPFKGWGHAGTRGKLNAWAKKQRFEQEHGGQILIERKRDSTTDKGLFVNLNFLPQKTFLFCHKFFDFFVTY